MPDLSHKVETQNSNFEKDPEYLIVNKSYYFLRINHFQSHSQKYFFEQSPYARKRLCQF